MAVEKCLICIANLKSSEKEAHTLKWQQLCSTLLTSENEGDKKVDCPLCPYCFNIVEETKELRQRLEEIRSEVRSKVMVIRARISDSDGNLQAQEYSLLNSLRQSLLGLLNSDEGTPTVQVKLEVQEEGNPILDSFFDYEDVQETLKEEIDDLNLLNVSNINADAALSYSLDTSEDERKFDSDSGSESEYELPVSKISNTRRETLKRKVKSSLAARKKSLKKPRLRKPRCITKLKKPAVVEKETHLVDDDIKSFECDDCGKSFKSESGWKSHCFNVHNKAVENKYACSLCDKTFDRRRLRCEHEKRDHEGFFPCSLCRRQFKAQGRLEVHIATAHETEEKHHTCPLCSKQFTLEISLNRHIRLHKFEKRKPFVCEVCDRRWANEKDLKKHKEIAHSKKRYTCSQCGHSLSSRSGLARHTRTHTGERPFKCELCDERFIDGVARIWHRQKVHSTTDQHHLCPICGQKFFNKYILKQHLERHEGKVYPCDICGKTGFKDRDALRTHKIRMHEEPGFVCDECGQKFSTSKGLKSHKMNHAGEKPHACDLCGSAFLSKWVLDNHRRSHTGERPFICTKCDKGFKARKHLVKHMQGVHAEAYTPLNRHECSYCGKCYPRNDTLEGHVRQVHTGERPFSCHLCSKTFAIKTNLRLHLKSHGVVHPQGPPRLPRSTRERPVAPTSETARVETVTEIVNPALGFNPSLPNPNPINPFQHFDPQSYPVQPIRGFH